MKERMLYCIVDLLQYFLIAKAVNRMKGKGKRESKIKKG